MSAYKKISTQFKNLESLKKALADVGFGHFDFTTSPRANVLPLEGWRGAGESVALRLPKSHYNAYEDTGFAWDAETGSYRAIVSTHDGSYTVGTTCYTNFGEETLQKVRQRYAYWEVVKQARMKGYAVRQVNDASGVIRLQLSKIA